MVSLEKLRYNLPSLFRLAQHDGLTIEVIYKRKVYELTITATNRTHMPIYRKRKPKPRNKLVINTVDCPECGYAKLGDVCINKKCPTNIKSN